MIYIAVMEEGVGGFSCLSKEGLSASEFSKLEKIKNPAKRAESLASRLLLKTVFEEKNGEAMPEILYTGEGKPYFCESELSFSLTHCNGLVAVSLSDEGDVGIDAESCLLNDKKLSGASKRFLAEDYIKEINTRFSYDFKSEESFEREISFYSQNHGKIQKCPDYSGLMLLSLLPEEDNPHREADAYVIRELSESSNEELLRAWCALEASLKADGVGFSGYSKGRLLKLVEKRDMYSFFLHTGRGVYSLCVAKSQSEEVKRTGRF